jgi:hypothetical protein
MVPGCHVGSAGSATCQALVITCRLKLTGLAVNADIGRAGLSIVLVLESFRNLENLLNCEHV